MYKKRRLLLDAALSLLLVAILASGWLGFSNKWADAAAKFGQDEVQTMKTVEDESESVSSLPLMDFTDLRAKNPDVIAWVTLLDTPDNLDYPVTQTADNDYYLHYDVNKQPSRYGNPFLDSRAHADFSDFSSVIYGHNMSSTSADTRAFHDLILFKKRDFFDMHPEGMLYTPAKTWKLEIFAVALIKPDDAIYNYAFASDSEKEAQLEMIRDKKAMYYRDVGVTAKDHIVVLSTCSYEYKDARTVVIAKLSDG